MFKFTLSGHRDLFDNLKKMKSSLLILKILHAILMNCHSIVPV